MIWGDTMTLGVEKGPLCDDNSRNPRPVTLINGGKGLNEGYVDCDVRHVEKAGLIEFS